MSLVIISHSHRFTFIHVSKAGGTSVEKALEPFLSWRDLYLGNPAFGQQMLDAFQERFALHKHSSVADVERLCGPEYVNEFYLFSLVRHPVDRLCSLYNFVGSTVHRWASERGIDPRAVASAINASTLAAYPFLDWAATKTFMTTSSFSEFIRHSGLQWDIAFQSQTARLCGMGGGPPKGEIFRLEESPSWLPRLRKALSLEFSLFQENRSDLRLISPDHLSTSDRRYIEQTFADDYSAFGY